MKTKVFKLSTLKHIYKIELKIEIDKKNIFTSWLHDSDNNKNFTNKRTFNISELKLAFDTLKPVCNKLELLEIKDFMFEKPEGEQFSLF